MATEHRDGRPYFIILRHVEILKTTCRRTEACTINNPSVEVPCEVQPIFREGNQWLTTLERSKFLRRISLNRGFDLGLPDRK